MSPEAAERGRVGAAARGRPRGRVPTLREERRLLRTGHVLVAGMDEVGRGALAGPVSVGVVVVDISVGSAPTGVRDSKLLTPAARQALVPRLRRWAPAHAVGHAEPAEIDRYGIIAALRLAGRRALAALPQTPTCVLLDGSHDWLSPPRSRRPGAGGAADDLPELETEPLFELDVLPVRHVVDLDRGSVTDVAELPDVPPEVQLACRPEVTTLVKADLRCAAVAAASVLAKVERDAIMVARSEDYPRYGWRENKGYSAPDHLAALIEHGPCDQHRRSWSLPGVPSSGAAGAGFGDVPDVAFLGGDLFTVLDLDGGTAFEEDAASDDDGRSDDGGSDDDSGFDDDSETVGEAFEDVRG